jgi:hypothetical protein
MSVSAQATETVTDFSGVWRFGIHPGYVLNIATDLQPDDVLPWASRLFVTRAAEFGASDPAKARCLPFGPRHIIGGGAVERVRIVQTPDTMVLLYEDLAHREVPLGRRTGAASLSPSYMGHASGEWQGDTLVVRNVGFTDRTWLDYTGHPNSEALEITERYRRTGPDRIERELRIVDPKTFTEPITIPTELTRIADQPSMLEYVCGENMKARSATSTGARHRPVVLPREALGHFVGEYSAGRGTGASTISIRLEGAGLVADVNGKGRVPLTALTATTFSGSVLGTYEFRSGSAGEVTRLFIHSIEGVTQAERVAGPAGGTDNVTRRTSGAAQ